MATLGKHEIFTAPLVQEVKLTTQLYKYVQLARSKSLDVNLRNNAWISALEVITEKNFISAQVKQHLQNTYGKELSEKVSRSPIIDDRVLTSFSTKLRHMVDDGEVDTEAAFAILEYFLRTKYHNLLPEQVVGLAKQFPPRRNVPFHVYKQRVELIAAESVIPGKSLEESWLMRREVMDMLEITHNIKQRYLTTFRNKTISIVDLMRISADALRTVHKASSRLGTQEITERDRLFLSGKIVRKAREPEKETALKLLKHPDILLGFLFTKHPRDFLKDAERVLQIPSNIQVEGVENIPVSGPVIVAFSHMNNWKDRTIPPYWEMAKMIMELQKHRGTTDIALAIWLGHFKHVASESMGKRAAQSIDALGEKIQERYGIEIIDVSKKAPRFEGFMEVSQRALAADKAILISPEGVPANEVVKPKRGIGMLARMSGVPVVGVAFVEELQPDRSFYHKVVFTPLRRYSFFRIPGTTLKEKDQWFADAVMRDIAHQLPVEKRGVFA
ncbi:1-acyl-sn-glycerol-3-phosphate acyltransferase [Candidatus Gottesmanbacteria bacterium]|nr:1-acyl-sn-glycerol-3-phosphate acyltransferase [Candidatus Gottesmanbacteria bacterium]